MESDAKGLVRAYIDRVWNSGDFDAVPELVSEHFVSHDPFDSEPVHGREGLVRLVRGYRAAFPDLVNTIQDQIAERDRVATRWSSIGTHLGPAFGLPATGRTRHVTGIVITRLEGGLVAEEWHSWDALGLMRQLGASPRT